MAGRARRGRSHPIAAVAGAGGVLVGGLKQQFAGDILVAGRAQLVQGLLAHDVVDELHLSMLLVVLGFGKSLYADHAEAGSLNLVESRQRRAVAIPTISRDR